MGLLVDLDVQVAGGAAAGPHLTLRGQSHAHTVTDAGRNLDTDLTAGPHPAVAATAVTRIRNDLADAATGGARTGCHDLAQQRTLHAGHLAAPTAGIAGHRRGIAVGALALAFVAKHGGVDGD